MHSLFDPDVYNTTLNRLQKLSPEVPAQWGKMNAAQMMAHCKEAFRVPLSEKKMKRMLMGYILGPMLKAKLYNEDPWKKNLPTAPNFVIKGDRDFQREKNELIEMINLFYQAGPHGISKHPHPFFGKYTPDQWGKAMYKHLDHHLRQFGV